MALKFLDLHLLRDEESRKRFRREAKAAAALDHPNICTGYEIGQEDDQYFIWKDTHQLLIGIMRTEEKPFDAPSGLRRLEVCVPRNVLPFDHNGGIQFGPAAVLE